MCDQVLGEGRRRDVVLLIEIDLLEVGEGDGKEVGCDRVETIVVEIGKMNGRPDGRVLQGIMRIWLEPESTVGALSSCAGEVGSGSAGSGHAQVI